MQKNELRKFTNEHEYVKYQDFYQKGIVVNLGTLLNSHKVHLDSAAAIVNSMYQKIHEQPKVEEPSEIAPEDTADPVQVE